MTDPACNPSDVLRELVGQYVDSVRDGADAVVVHYAWRKSGRDDGDFAAATAALHAAAELEILHGDQTFLRLTPQGFQSLPPPADVDLEPSDEPGRDTDFVQLNRLQMQSLVREIFQMAARAGETGLSATALAAIWGIEQQRAADLRGVIDDMLRQGMLRVERGDRTVFFLQ